jgi:hypothetical protein
MTFELSVEGSPAFYSCDQEWGDMEYVDIVFLQKYVAEALVKLGIDKAISQGKLTKEDAQQSISS